MDFSKLKYSDLEVFIQLNQAEYDQVKVELIADERITGRILNEDVIVAAELFNRLQQRGASTFTPSVIDLYIATQLKSQFQSTQRYSREQILGADNATIQQFVSIMGLPSSTDEETRKRIIRVLDYMELIFPLIYRELIDKLLDAKFYYRVPITDVDNIDERLTNDTLPRHGIFELEPYAETRYLVKIDSTYFIEVTLGDEWPSEFPNEDDTLEDREVSIPGFDQSESVANIPATPENMTRLFSTVDFTSRNIISNGKLTLPRTFRDSIYVDYDTQGVDINDEGVLLEYDHFEGDSRVLDYIEFVDTQS